VKRFRGDDTEKTDDFKSTCQPGLVALFLQKDGKTQHLQHKFLRRRCLLLGNWGHDRPLYVFFIKPPEARKVKKSMEKITRIPGWRLKNQ
jgi:hypothetical protein